MREAVEFEKEFVTDALPVDLIGMNKEMMCMILRRSLTVLQIFLVLTCHGTENPFDFMRALDVQNVTNFFEKRVSNINVLLIDHYLLMSRSKWT